MKLRSRVDSADRGLSWEVQLSSSTNQSGQVAATRCLSIQGEMHLCSPYESEEADSSPALGFRLDSRGMYGHAIAIPQPAAASSDLPVHLWRLLVRRQRQSVQTNRAHARLSRSSPFGDLPRGLPHCPRGNINRTECSLSSADLPETSCFLRRPAVYRSHRVGKCSKVS